MKYLACPDLHWSDVWLEVSKSNLKRVITAAKEQHVDFVLFPGDVYDHAVYATDKGGINDLTALIAELRAVCPVIAIYGTPSHDYKGCYGVLERAGLVVLQPGKMYVDIPVGNVEHYICEYDKHTTDQKGIHCLLFGLPEATKENFQANHPDLSADSVNVAAINAVHDIIRNEYAPMRSAYPDVPAILMLHGNVSDAVDRGSETDPILKASDIVIRTSVLAAAGFTRCELGHIHTPWESKICEAGYSGYAGIDRNPWGKTGFVPAMTLVEIEGTHVVNKTRIPYETTPMRLKITEPLASYDPSIAYWLDTKDQNAIDPAKLGAHPWSRITYQPDTSVERRVDLSGLEQAKTLPDLAKLYDKNITPAQLVKLAEAQKNVPQAPVVQRDVRVTDVTVAGCTMMHGKTAHIDVDHMPSGLVQIVGHNGSGKSSLLGWCTPYPCFIGKDTDSGRSSAIKDFFDQPESGIRKTVYLNGVRHDHVITIRGAHTKTPKTECYLSIDGVPQLEKATFEQMMSKCEELYGSLADYLMTSFYVQPLQGKFESGLMTANMVTVRDLVQNIAGINREGEKRYCLDRVNELDGTAKEERIRIDTERGTLSDKNAITAEISAKNVEKLQKMALKSELTTKSELAESTYTLAKSRYDHAQELINRRAELKTQLDTCTEDIKNNNLRANALMYTVDSATSYTDKLKSDDAVKQTYNAAAEKRSEVDKRNSTATLEYQKTQSRMKEILSEVESKKSVAREAYNVKHNEWFQIKQVNEANKQKRESLNQRIADINKPCPNCGYVAPEVELVIENIHKELLLIVDIELPEEPQYADPDLSTERTEYAQLTHVRAPVLEQFTMPPRGLSDAEIAQYKQIVDSAASSRAEANMIRIEIIPDLEKRIADLTKQHNEITVETVDITAEQTALQQARDALDTCTKEIANLEAQIATLHEQIKTTEARAAELDKRTSALESSLHDLDDWKYLADMLGSSHLPAMELDAVLDTIDTEATKQITPYRDGRYMYRSLTQQDGKSSVIDKFDIVVHDGETGEDKSLMKYSVGEKSFISDAYVKALVKVRKSRTKTEYNPVISDEADSFIEIPMIPAYYEMQKNYYGSDSRVLVVSHSPDAGNYIQNHVSMEEITK